MVVVAVLGPAQLLFLAVALLIAVLVGRRAGTALAPGLKEDQRKIVGGIAWLVAVALFVLGISTLDSPVGMAAIGFAVVTAVAGSVIIASK